MLWLTMDRAQFSHYLDAFLGSLKRNTAPLDWCEPNYAYTGFIAEFFNTVRHQQYPSCNRVLGPVSI